MKTVVSKFITDRHFLWGELISNYRYRIALPGEFLSWNLPITETDLWEFQQKIAHCTYRFSLEFQLISVTDTDCTLTSATTVHTHAHCLGTLISLHRTSVTQGFLVGFF